ncbi:FAD-dependent oxidoreductase, partial [bacterium]|nr:FAD-dependent oxidoreductase [bacterium]
MKRYGIIGGGPAGYTAGMMLASAGNEVVLFEKDKLGGTCLNRGCIPTKSFLHSSDLYSEVKNNTCGIEAENIKFDFSKVVEKKNNTIEKIRKSLELAVKNSGVKTVYAEACIRDKNTVFANCEEYKFDKIILATGAKPRVIKGLEFDGDFILSSDDILEIQKLPKSILIVGSGAIGIEWARILSNFDVEVTIVEMAEHLVPLADIEVSKRVERIFKQKKIKFYLNDCVENVENKQVTLKSGIVLAPEKILVAVGRVPVCPACECETILGDACGEIQLAHYAIHQAKQEVLGIPFDKKLVPAVIYGEP